MSIACPASDAETVLSCKDAVDYSLALLPMNVRKCQSDDDWRNDAWVEVCRMFKAYDAAKVPNFSYYVGKYLPATLLRAASSRFARASRTHTDHETTLMNLPEPDERHARTDKMGLDWFDPEFTKARGLIHWRQRLFLALRHREDWHQYQIAELFGLSPRAVREAFASTYDRLSQLMECPE